MEKTIKKVQDYFKNKIVSGDYRVVRKTEHRAILLVDNRYHFVIWIANGVFGLGITGEESIFSDSSYHTIYNFMDMKFTDEEKEIIYIDIIRRKVPQRKKKREPREIAAV